MLPQGKRPRGLRVYSVLFTAIILAWFVLAWFTIQIYTELKSENETSQTQFRHHQKELSDQLKTTKKELEELAKAQNLRSRDELERLLGEKDKELGDKDEELLRLIKENEDSVAGLRQEVDRLKQQRNATDVVQSGAGRNNNNQAESFRAPGELRFDWSNLKARSPVGRLLTQLRHQCDLPLRYHSFTKGGLGAELHAYSFSMCWAYQYKWRLYGVNNRYYDKSACDGLPSTVSQMNCYFGNLELPCPDDETTAAQQQSSPKRADYIVDFMGLWKNPFHDDVCQGLIDSTGIKDPIEMRSQVMEAMFTSGISPVLLEEAKRQHALVFPNGAPPPHQLITVHVRWGDKKTEMKLVPIREYIENIRKIVRDHRLEQVHVYLATEDPAAVRAFREAMDPSWHVYLDQFYTDMLPQRNNRTQRVAVVARRFARTGLLALGSLLVALEANHFVLTSQSNWSRLMNELRRSIINLHGCPPDKNKNCTTAVDMRKANFWMDLGLDGGGV